MKKRIRFILFLFITLWSFNSYAQINYDSIYFRLDTLRGVNKVNLITQSSSELAFSDLDFTIELVNQALSLSDSLSYRQGMVNSFYSLSFLQYLKGNLQESIKYGEKAIENTNEKTTYPVQRDIYIQLAKSYEEINAFDKSLQFYQLGYELSNQNKDNSGIGLAQLGIGLLYIKMNEYDIALSHLKSAFSLFESVNNNSGQAKSSIELARCFILLDQSDSVAFYINQSELLVSGDIQESDLFSVKVLYFKSIQIDSAIYYQNKLIQIASGSGRIFELEKLIMELSDLYAQAGDFTKAASTFNDYENLRDSLKMGGSQKNQILLQDRMKTAITDQETIDIPVMANDGIFTDRKTFYIILVATIVFVLIILTGLFVRFRFQKKSIIKLNRLENDIFSLTEELKKKDDQLLSLKENELVVKKQVATLRKLFAGEAEITRAEDQIQELSRKLAENINADLIGIWIYHPNDNSIENFDEYNKLKDIHRSGEIVHLDKCPLYKEALINSKYIDASSAQNDPRTMELCDSRLIPKDIHSKLDIPLILNNSLKGIVWIERCNNKSDWSNADIEFVLSISELVSQIVFNKILKETRPLSGLNEFSEGIQEFITGLENAENVYYGIRNISGDIKYVIGDYLELTGYSEDEILNINWYEFLTEELKDFSTDYYTKLVGGNSSKQSWVLDIIDKSNNVKPFSETIISTDLNDQMIFFEIRKIDNWSDDLSRIIENNALLGKTFESIQIPLFILDYKMAVLSSNSAFRKLINSSHKEIQGQDFTELLNNSNASNNFITHVTGLRDSDRRSITIEEKGKIFINSEEDAGTWQLFKHEEKGNIYLICQQLSKPTLVRAEEEADFDNLYEILGLKGKEYLKKVIRVFIQDILHRNKAFLGQINLPDTFSEIETTSLIEENFRLNEFLFQLDKVISIKSDNLINFHYEKESVEYKISYPLLFTVAVLELVQNALQAIKGSGDIYFSISEGNHQLEINLTDTGEGMRPEARSKAFLPFYSSFSKGTTNGIGLSAIKEILKYTKGSIKISSQLGRGTEMKVKWPE